MESFTQQGFDNILLIDTSNKYYIEGLSSVARSHNFKIKGFSTNTLALDWLKSNLNEIGVVILDLHSLNSESGNTLILVKKIAPLIPVLIFSGDSKEEKELAIKCMNEGAFNYAIRKEIELETLFIMLKVVVNQYIINIENERYSSIKEEFRNKTYLYEKMLRTTEAIIKNILNENVMFSPTFESRIKTFKSFYNKLKQKESKEGFIKNPFIRINDIAGLRVIFFNANDLHTAVELILKSNDFIDANPENKSIVSDDKSKTYGYRAVHFDIKLNSKKRLNLFEYEDLLDIACEIQFKTVFAHSWSKIHHVLSYKEINELNLTNEEHYQLNKDFIEAAKGLEHIEKEITDLCVKYYPKK